jgi:EmrB/QacA subfamily drug resistance transporter
MNEPTTTIDAKTKAVVAGLMLSIFLVALDSTIVSTAMPSIIGSLGGFSLYAWVPSVYLLASSVLTPIYGKLADLFGRKRILFFGICVFLLGSVACGAATSMPLLIIARAIQGIGAGAIFPITITIVGDLFTLEQRARIQGVFSSVWGVSAVIGPLFGGTLVDSVGWRWIFYLNIPFGVLAVLVLWRWYHEELRRQDHQLDWAGASYLAVGSSAILLLFLEGGQAWSWVSWQTGILALIGALCVALFLRAETRAAEPVIPLDLFLVRIIAVSVLGGFFAGVVMIGVSFEVPLYVQGVLGKDAFQAGLALAPLTIGWPLASSQSGKLALRFGYRWTAASGLVCQTIGAILLLTLGLHSPYPVVSSFSFLIGVGLGLSSTPMIIAVQSAVAWARRGAATATNMFVRSFGQVVGLAAMGVIINHAAGKYSGSAATNQSLDIHARQTVAPAVLQQIHQALLNGIHGSFFSLLLASVIGLGVALQLPSGSAREHELGAQTATIPDEEKAGTRTA